MKVLITQESGNYYEIAMTLIRIFGLLCYKRNSELTNLEYKTAESYVYEIIINKYK